jgi:hypothetical protein
VEYLQKVLTPPLREPGTIAVPATPHYGDMRTNSITNMGPMHTLIRIYLGLCAVITPPPAAEAPETDRNRFESVDLRTRSLRVFLKYSRLA